MIHLMIIEDHAGLRRNLITYAGLQEDIKVVGEFSSIETFLKDLSKMQQTPTIALLDIGLPGKSGIEGIPLINEQLPEMDIIILTAYEEEEQIVQALTAGACSYLSKRTSLEQIMASIRIVSQGGSYMSPTVARILSTHLSTKSKSNSHDLSPKQKEVMHGLSAGLSYKDIAEQMGISIHTVRTHIKRIYNQLHVKTRSEAVAKYLTKK